MIKDALFDVANVLIKNKVDYTNLSDELKDKYFFIINRYLSKIYPKFANSLNHKKIDKPTAFDCWFYFLYDEPYPNMWSKSPKLIKQDVFSDKERSLLINFYDISEEDLFFANTWFNKQVKEDLKWLLSVDK